MQNATPAHPLAAADRPMIPNLGELAPEPAPAGMEAPRPGAPLLLCRVVGGEPAYDFAGAHGLPVKTYCGAWLYPDVIDEAEAIVGLAKDCPLCDLAADEDPT
jgi:hypothetical protein